VKAKPKKPKKCLWCGRVGTRDFSLWDSRWECSNTWACGKRATRVYKLGVKKT
jgi:hypothetical protein